jgi:hypothetical protein
MSYNNIYNYYKTLHILKKHGYDLYEQGDMIPFEREVFLQMIIEDINNKEKMTTDKDRYYEELATKRS